MSEGTELDCMKLVTTCFLSLILNDMEDNRMWSYGWVSTMELYLLCTYGTLTDTEYLLGMCLLEITELSSLEHFNEITYRKIELTC